MVVVCHSRGYNWVEWGRLPIADQTLFIKSFFAMTRAGGEWVIVFFVLSGFLVGGGVISRCLKGAFDLRLFAIDRVSRIWVPLIPALLLTLGVAHYCGLPASLWDLFGNILALQGVLCKNFAHNEPLWSLSFEVWFYIFIGSVGVILMNHKNYRYIGFFVLGLSMIVLMKLNAYYLCCWVLGAFSLFLVTENVSWSLFLFGIIVALFGFINSQLQADSLSMSHASYVRCLPSRSVAALIESAGIGLLIAAICKVKPSSPMMLRVEKQGTTWAAFSYTLYLTHYPILGLWEHFVPERSPAFTAVSFAIFVAKICSCLLAGWLLYLPFEAQTPAVRAWMRRRWGGAAPVRI